MFVLTGCSTSANQQPHPAERATSITVAMGPEPTTLDPTRGFAPDGAAKLFDGLLEHRSDGELDPVLAATVPQQDSTGKQWTVHLRAGVTFSDHSPLRASDVVTTYQLARTRLSTRFAMLKSVKALDDQTVQFTLTRQDPAFAQTLTLGIASATSLKAKADPPIGTGPYTLTARQPGTSLTPTARKDHFRAVPRVDTITAMFTTTQAQRLRLAKEHKVDVAAVNASASVEGYQAVKVRTAGYLSVSLPAQNAVTKDSSMRAALNRMVDRDALLGGDLAGVGIKAFTPITDVLPEFVDTKAVFHRDVRAAKNLLTTGGWVLRDGVRSKNGVDARLRLHYSASDVVAQSVAKKFASQVKSLGVLVTPVAEAPEPTQPAIVVNGRPFEPDPGALSAPSSAVRKTLRIARGSTDLGKRATAYRAFDRAYAAAPTMVVLARLDQTYLIEDRWRGYPQFVVDPITPGFNWGLLFDLQNWTT